MPAYINKAQNVSADEISAGTLLFGELCTARNADKGGQGGTGQCLALRSVRNKN